MVSGSNSRRFTRVFLDTEFTDFLACELISVGLKAETGEEFYGENLDFNDALSSDFVRANIYPLLDRAKYGMKELELSARLWQWLDELPYDKVEIYADYQTDWDLLQNLLRDEHPKLMPPTNLFAKIGTQCLISSALAGPEGFVGAHKQALTLFNVEFLNHFFETGETQHHALSDARANCRGFLAVERSLGQAAY